MGEALTPDDPVRAEGQAGHTGKGNRYLKGVLGEVATAAAKADTFLGARYQRLVRDPDARYVDLGSDYYTNRLDPDRKTRDLVRQLQALGHTVELTSAA